MSELKRHILILSSWFPSRVDLYSGNFVERFAGLLADKYEVTVIFTTSDASCKTTELEDTFEKNVRIIRVYHPKYKFKIKRWWIQRKAFNKALELINHVDLIFANVFLPRAHQFIKAQKYFDCPMILLEHGSYFRRKPRKMLNPFQKQAIRIASRHCKHIFAVSEVLKKDMQPLFPTTKIGVLPNFVDPDVFQLRTTNPQKRVKFIHISTLDKSTKSVETLFDGFLNAYLDSNKEISLTIVSDQSTAELEKWARLNKCEQGFRFIGPSNSDKIAQLIQEHDALILTSEYETFSIVVAEAWMTGTPVISTSVGIATDMPSYLGVQIRNNSISDLKNTLLSFTRAEHAFDAAAIRLYAQQFSRSTVLNQLEQLFEATFEIEE